MHKIIALLALAVAISCGEFWEMFFPLLICFYLFVG